MEMGDRMRRRFNAPIVLAVGIVSMQPFVMRTAYADAALVISTDYSTAYYSRLDLSPPFAHTNNIGAVCADAGARAHDGKLYVLGRLGCDHVQVIDGTTFATLDQWSTGNGTNPQDIEVVSPTKAYISLYERDYVLIVNPQTGATLGSVSLATFADADGLPEAADMALVGDRLFVALQRLDRPGGYVASNPSYVAVIDCTTDQLIDVDPQAPGVQAIVLSGRNPFSDLTLDPVRQKLYVAEAGNFGVLDGGVEFIDPVTLHAEGLFVTESALGGDLNAVRLWTDCTGYAIVNDASFRTKLVRFDRCGGTALGTSWQSAGFDLCDVEIDFERAHVLITDRDLVTPGVRIFAAGSGNQITTSPIDFGLPPCELVLVNGTPPADGPVPARPTLTLTPNWPDPFNPSTSMRIEADGDRSVRLEIFDIAGRRVRTLWDGIVPSGGRTLQWDGRDGTGVPLPSGVYLARLVAGNEIRGDRLTLVR
jgi:FlgD Ig-like domain